MAQKFSLDSLIIPKDTVEINFVNFEDLITELYSIEDLKNIKKFIKELLQILDVYDFEHIRFIFNEENKSYYCYLSEYELIEINTVGLSVFIDPLPMLSNIKKELINITKDTDQATPKYKEKYGSNVIKIYCDPDNVNIEDLKNELLKGFRYLVKSLIDISFDSIDQDHDIDLLKYFDLEFLLEVEKEEIDTYTEGDDYLLKGETDLIEYKSSIFWSERLSKGGGKIETRVTNFSQNEILRTINGFMNSGGGDLIIGLHDKFKDEESGYNLVRKDFLEEIYSQSDFDRYLLKIRDLLEFGFGTVASGLCKIDRISLGVGLVWDDEIIPKSKKNFKEKIVNDERDRFVLRVRISSSPKPVFVNLKREECRDHECENCQGTGLSPRYHTNINSKAFFVRSSTSATEQYNFVKTIEHIQSKYPSYFNYIADNKDLE
tara:strand:- start:811 stop:2109 length:1299 start_codon:yes stop_codon:yes gene_type:complete